MKNLKKKYIVLFTALFLLTVFMNALFSVEDMVKIEKTGHRKPQIEFNHRAHSNEYVTNCDECHHKSKGDEKNIKKCSSEGCHTIRDQDNKINLKGAFHQQCHDCHRRTSGPKACGRCHIKTQKR